MSLEETVGSPRPGLELSGKRQTAVAGSGLVGRKCRCAACSMSIHTVRARAPTVCPFCQARLVAEIEETPPWTPEPEEVARAPRVQSNSRDSSRRLTIMIGSMGIALLALAVVVKLNNIEYFWYQPWVNFYSLVVGVFILSRFIIAAFYSAPPDVGFLPTVAVIVAARNESDAIGKTIGRIYAEGYPKDRLETIVVNDGSTDGTLAAMRQAQGRHPTLTIVDFETNKGKRHGMAIGALLAHAEFLVYVDSDSFLMPGSIRKVLQGLANPTVAAVSGHTDVENVQTNALSKMQDERYFVSYRVMKAAESVFGAVSCCPGCFSAYRKTCVLNVLDRWLHQRFLGRYCTYGDDRSLTNYLLRDYRILYDDEALATTIVPEKWGKYVRQQARWKRSWVREFLFAGRWMWRKHPVAVISWYTMTLLPLIAPVVMFYALVLGPFMNDRPAAFYVGGVLLVTLLWSFYYLEKTGRTYWWTAFLFTITYMLFFSWQGYYSLLTVRKTKWGTR